ncbi:protein of unknown function [Bradyrhizobium vignae]|uniref:Uncharacterized protein n=1 Tax=Bradyrhizobium vignae TaxID=1549949 RepID=A0A2U3PT62_9BRAD|nr:protein of unknown function [Bradyrhizobium vignae]
MSLQSGFSAISILCNLDLGANLVSRLSAAALRAAARPGHEKLPCDANQGGNTPFPSAPLLCRLRPRR